MPRSKKHTNPKYPGIYWINARPASGAPKQRRYYARYVAPDGREHDEAVGWGKRDNMTFAKAQAVRVRRINGDEESNVTRRERKQAEKEADAARWTFDRLWNLYIDKTDLRAPGTERSRYVKHVQPVFGDKEPQEVIPLNVQRLIKNLKEKNLSAQTQQHAVRLLIRLARFGSDNRLCAGLSFRPKVPKVSTKPQNELSPAQLAGLLDVAAAQGAEIGALFKLAAFTGCRRGELLRLRWGDIDQEAGTVTITNRKSGYDLIIPLNAPALAAIRSLPRGSEYLFDAQTGAAKARIKRRIQKVGKLADLPDGFRPLHGLRHHFASTLGSSGYSIEIIASLLGHKLPGVTARYTTISEDVRRDAAERAGELIKAKAEAGNAEHARQTA